MPLEPMPIPRPDDPPPPGGTVYDPKRGWWHPRQPS